MKSKVAEKVAEKTKAVKSAVKSGVNEGKKKISGVLRSGKRPIYKE